jgi:hypothetical protein
MLPIIKLTIEDELNSDLEVNCVSFVDAPAIEKNFFAFNKNYAFAFAEERVVIGAAMIPDMPIYRRDEQGEYNVIFDKQTINKIAEKFYAKNLHQNSNIGHTGKVEGVNFFMSFIKDDAKGILGMKGEYPDGTWFLGAKVSNDDLWGKIKSGEVKGFSVEGLFKQIPMKHQKYSVEEAMKLIEDILSGTHITD